jgi:adenylyltransferase/sulfurtransferase
MELLSDDQLLRYARNILLSKVDIGGQQTLLASPVVVVGAGGLGSPVIQYLAAAGVGKLSVIDDDVVDETNLQRQVIHSLGQVGNKKVSSAAAAVSALNPDVCVVEHAERLTKENAHRLLHDADIVVIGTDNFSSRYTVNETCLTLKIPLVTGAAIGTSGQITSFNFQDSADPCFQCVYEQADDEALTCATAGVLGPVVGTIGSMMAMETIKILLSIGKPLYGRLMIWDALTMEWQTFSYTQSDQCPTCSKDKK